MAHDRFVRTLLRYFPRKTGPRMDWSSLLHEHQMPTLAAGAIGVALWLLSIIFAYREGKRIGAHTRSERFNQLPSALRLNGTEWDVCFTEFGQGPARKHTGWMRFRQYDSRVIGQGEDDLGRSWTAEGVVYRDKLCYVVLDADGSGRSLGTVMVDRQDSTGVLEGMRCVWSPDQNAVSVQPIRLRDMTLLRERPAANASVAAVTIGDEC